MRLLIPLDNPGGGGIARVGTGLAAGLALHLPSEDQLVILGDARGVQARHNVRLLGGSADKRGVRRALADQARLLRPARRVDLVHMTDYKAPLLSSTPFSVTVHDVASLDHPEWFPVGVRTYKRLLLDGSLLKGPRLIVCVSEHTRDRLRAHHPRAFGKSMVRVIYPGVDAPRIEARGPRDESDRYFLTVSAIEPRKNHLGLLQAFRSAVRAGLRLRWKIVGSPQYDAEAIMAALRSADGVDLVGRASEPQLDQLYHDAVFVATPSFEEGFGYPPLEAMVRGVPVVCSTGSALDETVGDAALRVRPGDHEGWTDALLKLESDASLRARLIEAGRKQAGLFTWERSAAAHIEAFHAAL